MRRAGGQDDKRKKNDKKLEKERREYEKVDESIKKLFCFFAGSGLFSFFCFLLVLFVIVSLVFDFVL